MPKTWENPPWMVCSNGVGILRLNWVNFTLIQNFTDLINLLGSSVYQPKPEKTKVTCRLFVNELLSPPTTSG